ncbi:Putative sugar phosphate isomerase YwlF [Sedimentisphaera cyanobacteriorum]|uniref:Sugar phosphate isomerase YwlF n=1 Tax=Sedimentisphaera cyanobacteriorum TaxID=1940790 RepID=A0A1Q2HMX5_9BACT|nr:ribose 5-phosphate isomerase B [Sedimentisphaera cyanobacteriorum]AQQ08802.1 Putative sugar phosphate isomerase YwlF [Sedimentisphaera cyanobacteriorum]
MIIALANDHRGYETKILIRGLVEKMGHECVDYGSDGKSPVDYPDVGYSASIAVSNGEADRGILICGTGIGMCITANKVKNVRGALCFDEINARVSRQHNDANVLCLSGDLLGESSVRRIVEVWLETDFMGGRHQQRLDKVRKIEQGEDPRE